MTVRRVFVEKKPSHAFEARAVCQEIREVLRIPAATGVRIWNRYDVEGADEALFETAKRTVFSEPPLDVATEELPRGGGWTLAVEPLPGQYDQRAESAADCLALIGRSERPRVRTAKVYRIEGDLSPEEKARIRTSLVNPVESREAAAEKPETLELESPLPEPPAVLAGFREMDAAARARFVKEKALAMDEADLAFCQEHFAKEGRDPTETELKVLDTYWSDHCRHTTFSTRLEAIDIRRADVAAACDRYRAAREAVYGERAAARPVCLMDVATLAAKLLAKEGKLPDLDRSEEINACSVKVEATVKGKKEPWLLMFKNETHNHPTEIEPFGGAATCIGGAVRDPLSGRTFVHQAIRVTGAADPRAPVESTLPGKLPQRRIVLAAAAGYSSYGNQLGLATGLVDELYHPGYVAKRLEIGAVAGAAPARNVRRERPAPGDAVVLLGGRTGRDGCGGATGSSKRHEATSLATCAAEVQKGNAPTERKLQRLFRDGEVTRLVKRCNDFGAGGVSVAIGELADGLDIDLSKVPRKYEGLTATELAISESQERMAVVLAAEDVDAFLQAAARENLEATVVATVTDSPRMVMRWNGRTVCDLSREFLASNGAPKTASVRVPALETGGNPPENGENRTGNGSFAEKMVTLAGSLACASRQGLCERFDSTVGARTVLMPFGGRRQRTPAQVAVSLLPVEGGETTTVSALTFGCRPELLAQDPFRGAYLAVLESISKLVAAGFARERVHLTFQEYFGRTGTDPERWGRPFAALLGAFSAQLDFGRAAIGGKDSMSGSFEGLDVPGTLCSFAVASGEADEMLVNALLSPGHDLRLLSVPAFDGESAQAAWDAFTAAARRGEILSAHALGPAGLAEGAFKMAAGNDVGVAFDAGTDVFAPRTGAILFEAAAGCALGEKVGATVAEETVSLGGESVPLETVLAAYEGALESVFPFRGRTGETTEAFSFDSPAKRVRAAPKIARPKAFVPVFPGTNCEYETLSAIRAAGIEAESLVVRNLAPGEVAESVREAAKRIRQSQMLVLPGGFSGGDEPDGAAKFIAAFFRAKETREAVEDLLDKRDGLVLGICNGFQALVKLGLVPYGRILEQEEDSPTLAANEIGRHQSRLVTTRVASTLSPWLAKCRLGEEHLVAISHGEGRFTAPEATIRALAAAGQIATQYVDSAGRPSMDLLCNPAGSAFAIEGITSPDGRVYGKMGHSERGRAGLYRNVPGNRLQPLFASGAAYFA
ncbi:MAG: phosphoribosylformylglycinamidine synthase [Kiritimatiellae bacterium]|nr:phosphoribosylformylglycinamidine synthase [Kiritimatiellia bacterium]